MPVGYQFKAYSDAERALLELIARQRGISIEQAEIELVKEWAAQQPDMPTGEPTSVVHFPEVGHDG